jgi:general stress protein 26
LAFFAVVSSTELDRVWQIIEKAGVCMLTTRFQGGLRARPLEARPDRTFGRLLFMTDVYSGKRDQVERWPEVGLVFIDAAGKAYLSISGKGL